MPPTHPAAARQAVSACTRVPGYTLRRQEGRIVSIRAAIAHTSAKREDCFDRVPHITGGLIVPQATAIPISGVLKRKGREPRMARWMNACAKTGSPIRNDAGGFIFTQRPNIIHIYYTAICAPPAPFGAPTRISLHESEPRRPCAWRRALPVGWLPNSITRLEPTSAGVV